MLVFRLTMSRIKITLRSKEFYFYIIGFPLIFLLIFVIFQPISSVQTRTLAIGVVDDDVQVVDGDLNATYLWSDHFITQLRSKDPLTEINYFETTSYDDLDSMQKDIAKLEITGGIHVPQDFSRQVTNYVKSRAYFLIVTSLSDYIKDNPGEAARIGPIIQELSQNASALNTTIQLEFYGDAALASTHEGYTRIWKVLPQFLVTSLAEQLPVIWEHLQQKLNLQDVNLNMTADSITTSSRSTSFNISLIQAGTKGAIKNIQQEYFARLVPGQILQSVLMLSTGVVVFVGEEKRSGILRRLKLSRMTTTEYLMGNFLAWGIISMIQTVFFVAVASLFGTVPFEFRPLELLFVFSAVFLAGLFSASLAYIVGSYINYRAAIPLLTVVLITGSMLSFEYFFTIQDPLFTLFERSMTILDLAPWRAPFLVLKKGLMLPTLFTWEDLIIDMLLTIVWAVIFLGVAVIIFQRRIFRYQEIE